MSTKIAELPLATSKDQILNVPDRATEDVPVPEWGFRVTVKALSGTDRDKYQADFWQLVPDKAGMRVTGFNRQNQMARLVALSIVNADGRPMFTDADVIALGQKSAVALERVSDVAMRLSGLQAATVEALKDGLKETRNGTHGSD